MSSTYTRQVFQLRPLRFLHLPEGTGGKNADELDEHHLFQFCVAEENTYSIFGDLMQRLTYVFEEKPEESVFDHLLSPKRIGQRRWVP